jgi:hypothetical protein
MDCKATSAKSFAIGLAWRLAACYASIMLVKVSNLKRTYPHHNTYARTSEPAHVSMDAHAHESARDEVLLKDFSRSNFWGRRELTRARMPARAGA